MKASFSFFLFWLSVEAEWTLFQRKESHGGKTCQDADIAFTKEYVSDKTICSIKCVNHMTCVSIFHVQNTGSCTGCTVSYDASTSLTGLTAGSIYYTIVVGCPEGWFNIDNFDSCYIIPADTRNFENAVEHCESLNAHIVITETEDENNSLMSKINSLTLSGVIAFFVGFTDASTEGVWTAYGTTNQLTFSNWANGEPNGETTEDCLAMYVPFNLLWADISCSSQLNFICEK